jgi:hypothetical protein
MNARLNLDDGVAALKLSLPANVLVSDAYAVGYLRDFGTKFPAVWVLAQRARSNGDDTDGYAGLVREHFTVEFVVRCVVQRYSEGATNAGAALNALMDSVTNTLLGKVLPGCDKPLAVVSTQDGPASETVVYADIVFSTVITYTKSVGP